MPTLEACNRCSNKACVCRKCRGEDKEKRTECVCGWREDDKIPCFPKYIIK